MKPFIAHLTEQEQDYEYKLCSIENIHTDEMMDKIRLALGRYGLISVEVAGVQTKTPSNDDDTFGKYPFTNIYVTKVLLSNPLSSRSAVQSVALFTRIKDDKINFLDKNDKTVVDGAEVEQHAHPIEVPGKDAQEEVGNARVDSLMSELIKDLEAVRTAKTVELEVYESWVASHHEVKKIMGHNVARGFYLGEQFTNGQGCITGPFAKYPDGHEYLREQPEIEITESKQTDGLVKYHFTY